MKSGPVKSLIQIKIGGMTGLTRAWENTGAARPLKWSTLRGCGCQVFVFSLDEFQPTPK
jgi:hypothetical protein